MRLVIASDIHGSAYWCRKLLEQVEVIKPDKLILLGDILYHGPRNDLPLGYAPKEVIAMLNPLAELIVCCRGNCEAEVDQMVLNFPCMSDYSVVVDNDKSIFCTHGHLYNPQHLPKLCEGSYFFYGHTHIKDNRTECGIHIFNPGSVSLPKDGSHSFGIWEDGFVEQVILKD